MKHAIRDHRMVDITITADELLALVGIESDQRTYVLDTHVSHGQVTITVVEAGDKKRESK